MNILSLEKFLSPQPAERTSTKKSKTVGSLQIKEIKLDLSRPAEDQVLPCSLAEQSSFLNWSVADVRRFNNTSGIYTTLPMLCEGQGCFWASQCPTKPDFPFLGKPCPILINRAYVRFVSLVNELGVTPDDIVDMDMVLDLVRIEVQLAICDMQLSIEGMLVPIYQVSQRSGELLASGKDLHPLLRHQQNLRKSRNELYKALNASRIEKQKSTAAAIQTKRDVLDVMDMLSRAADRRNSGKSTIDVNMETLSSLPQPDNTANPEDDEDIFFIDNN